MRQKFPPRPMVERIGSGSGNRIVQSDAPPIVVFDRRKWDDRSVLWGKQSHFSCGILRRPSGLVLTPPALGVCG